MAKKAAAKKKASVKRAAPKPPAPDAAGSFPGHEWSYYSKDGGAVIRVKAGCFGICFDLGREFKIVSETPICPKVVGEAMYLKSDLGGELEIEVEWLDPAEQLKVSAWSGA